MKQSEIIVPFLKWAGGKRWLAPTLKQIIDFDIDTYFEPFLGSGSIFFALRPERAVLSDQNSELINCYTAIRDRPDLVLNYLKQHAKHHSDEYYYEMRQRRLRSRFSRAAQFLYLNRTCWNGLYRVNRRGEFNVPRGTKNSVILETDDFHRTSCALSGVQIANRDFETSMSQAKANDLIFADPPYTVKHNNNGFVKYNQNIFSWADQERLARSAKAAAERGATVIISNADHESIWDLHHEHGTIYRLPRKSIISGKTIGRGGTSEALIVYGHREIKTPFERVQGNHEGAIA